LQLTLDELKNENDKVTESRGVKVVYEPDIEEYISNSIIDYSDNWFKRGFVLRGARSSTC
jgi:Uncharacterized conserved protein